MKELEKVLKALANRRRLAILKFLQDTKEATVGDIATEIELSFKSTSRHLAILLAKDIIEREQRSTKMFYRIAAVQKPASRAILKLL